MKSYLPGFLFFNKRGVCQLYSDHSLVWTSLWATVYREISTLHFQLLLLSPISHLCCRIGFFCWAVTVDLSSWIQIFQVPLHGIKLRRDRPNVINGFRTALPVVGLHSPLDLDLDLPPFYIRIFLHILLSNWQLFLHFNLLMVVVVVVVVMVMVMIMVVFIQHQHQPLFMNMEIYLLTFSVDCICFPLFLLLLHMVVVFACH